MTPAVCVLLLASGPALQDSSGVLAVDELAFVEVTVPRDTFWIHEPVPLRLGFGFEERFLAENVVSLFRRELDLPVQVTPPWAVDLAGAEVLERETTARAVAGPSFALGNDIVYADHVERRTLGGHSFSVAELEARILPRAPGAFRIPPPRMRFAHARVFDQGAFGARVPRDREESTIAGSEVLLRILPLPEEDRPIGFTGGVGRFTVRATAHPLTLEVGESLTLELQIGGEGHNLSAPRLEGLDAFHVRGMVDGPDKVPRTVVYDLAPRDWRVREVPPIPIAYFDPTPPAGYRTVRTAAIPIEVLPPDEEATPPEGPTTRRRGPFWLAAGFVLLLLIGLALRTRRARSRSSPR